MRTRPNDHYQASLVRSTSDRAQLVWWMIAVGAPVLIALAAYVAGSGSFFEAPKAEAAITVIVTGSFVLCGLMLARVNETRSLGFSLCAIGLAFLMEPLSALRSALLFTVANVLAGIFIALFVRLVVKYGLDRPLDSVERSVLLFTYLAVGPLVVLNFFFYSFPQCPDCPRNLLLITTHGVVAQVAPYLQAAAISAALILVVLMLSKRWRTANSVVREYTVPIVVGLIASVLSMALILVAMLTGHINQIAGRLEVTSVIGLVLTPVAYAYLISARGHSVISGRRVRRLLRHLTNASTTEEMRITLAQALRDDSVDIVYWSERTEQYVDSRGVVAQDPGNDRVYTDLTSNGRRIGAIIHDRFIDGAGNLIQDVASAATFALENEHLRAELNAYVKELEASRARIVHAGAAERRKIERDLHDGVQQHILAIMMKLQISDTTRQADSQLLGDLSNQLERLLTEIRELGQGIYPSVLTDYGIVPALKQLAINSMLPVHCELCMKERPGPDLEAAIYFVAAELLANAVKYSNAGEVQLVLHDRDGLIELEIRDMGRGGATISAGRGLAGLVDRVRAVGGKLRIESPDGQGTTVTASFKCG